MRPRSSIWWGIFVRGYNSAMKITIRDLLWLTLVAALGSAWHVNNLRMFTMIDRSRTEAHINFVSFSNLKDRVEDAKRRGLSASEISGSRDWDDERRYTKADYRQLR
jgi:hypothetical protein